MHASLFSSDPPTPFPAPAFDLVSPKIPSPRAIRSIVAGLPVAVVAPRLLATQGSEIPLARCEVPACPAKVGVDEESVVAMARPATSASSPVQDQVAPPHLISTETGDHGLPSLGGSLVEFGDELISLLYVQQGDAAVCAPMLCLVLTSTGDILRKFLHRRDCLFFLYFFLKHGIVFSHCKKCKAQSHLQSQFFEGRCPKMKFQLFVARDILLVFLAVQALLFINFEATAVDKDDRAKSEVALQVGIIFFESIPLFPATALECIFPPSNSIIVEC
ncbi:hypothetical protein EJB05_16243, partial [Eragrostis curvula]